MLSLPPAWPHLSRLHRFGLGLPLGLTAVPNSVTYSFPAKTTGVAHSPASKVSTTSASFLRSINILRLPCFETLALVARLPSKRACLPTGLPSGQSASSSTIGLLNCGRPVCHVRFKIRCVYPSTKQASQRKLAVSKPPDNESAGVFLILVSSHDGVACCLAASISLERELARLMTKIRWRLYAAASTEKSNESTMKKTSTEAGFEKLS